VDAFFAYVEEQLLSGYEPEPGVPLDYVEHGFKRFSGDRDRLRSAEIRGASCPISCPSDLDSSQGLDALNRLDSHQQMRLLQQAKELVAADPGVGENAAQRPALDVLGVNRDGDDARVVGVGEWWWLPLERASFQPFFSRTRISCRGRTDGSRPLTRRR
jgi:hypothetical protein